MPAEPPGSAGKKAAFKLLRENPQTGEGGSPVRLVEMQPGEFVGLSTFQSDRIGSSLFSINSSGNYRTVHQFPPFYAGYSLIKAPDGVLFGDGGMASGADRKYSYFSVGNTPDHVVQQFPAASGSVPGVILGNMPDGKFYGLTTSGFQSYSLVSIDRRGQVTSLHKFTSAEGVPYRGESLTRSRTGEFTGVAVASFSGAMHAWIYRIAKDGQFRKLADIPNFRGSRVAPVLEGSDGDIYVGIPLGGRNQTGAILRVEADGSVSTLADFPPGNNALARPAFLMEAADGLLYGSNSSQPSSIFNVDRKTGKLNLIYEFDSDGPQGTCVCRFIQAADGKFYGVATAGGHAGTGTVFSLDAGLGKPK